MRLTKEVRPSHKSPRSENLSANRGKALIGLLSRRAGLFVLFSILFGLVFSAHFAQFYRFAHEQEYAPHFSLILLVSLYLLLTRRQQLFARAEYWPQGGIPLLLIGVLGYLLGLHLQPSLSPNDFLAL